MSDNYTGHMLVQILDEIKTVHELVAVQPTRGEFNELRQDLAELKQDMKVVKAAVKNVSEWQANHDSLHAGAGPSDSNGRVSWLKNAQAVHMAGIDYGYLIIALEEVRDRNEALLEILRDMQRMLA